MPQFKMGFPNIPGVVYTGLNTTRYLFDYGSDVYRTGITTINRPRVTPPYQDNPANGPICRSYVPETDGGGNDIAGVRLPDVTVPPATYTGWALRSGPQANDACEGSGQMIPFPRTGAERAAAERYKSFHDYHRRAVDAIDRRVEERLMLCEDADDEQTRLNQAGLAAGVPPPKDGMLAALRLPHG